jgi:hypothetical protein
MKRRIAIWALPAFFLATSIVFGIGTNAYAVSYGPDCGTGNCFGSIYTLNSTFFNSTSTTETHDFTLSVNTAGYNGPGSGLDAVAIKTVSKSSDIVSSALIAQPGTFSAATIAGLSANGCGVGASNGFVCTQSSNLGGVSVPNGTYAFTFRTTFASGALLAENEWSIKGLYVDALGKQAGLTSVSGGAVPIPGTLFFFGAGFASFIAWHRMSKHSS